MSYSSVASSIAEEQINLIAELKSERNTLVEEIAGWRTRVQDLERQAELYLNKINSERTESKLARDRVLELEKEQGTWESDRAAFNNAIARAREDGASWRAKYEEALKGECHWQAKALGLDSDVKRLEKELAALRTVTPTKKWNVILSPRRFDDSMSSTSTADVRDEAYVVSTETEVFKIRPRPASPLPNMDVVVEEEEDEVYESSCEEPSLDDNEPRCVEEDEGEVCSAMLGMLSFIYDIDTVLIVCRRNQWRPVRFRVGGFVHIPIHSAPAAHVPGVPAQLQVPRCLSRTCPSSQPRPRTYWIDD
jgi:hypothetical protein